jgi:hypothetical protein
MSPTESTAEHVALLPKLLPGEMGVPKNWDSKSAVNL